MVHLTILDTFISFRALLALALLIRYDQQKMDPTSVWTRISIRRCPMSLGRTLC